MLSDAEVEFLINILSIPRNATNRAAQVSAEEALARNLDTIKRQSQEALRSIAMRIARIPVASGDSSDAAIKACAILEKEAKRLRDQTRDEQELKIAS